MKTDSYTHKGLTIEIGIEEYAEHADPRECDNISTMVCWHPDYVLGDEQIRGSRGAVETVFETERGRTDFDSMRQIERYLRFARKAVVTMPLYLYDHSGISMSVGAPSPFDNPTVRRDEFGRGMGWDTSMVGFIYTTAERIEELCGPPRDGDEFYCPPDWEGTSREWIEDQLRSDVRYYDAYLQGSVYYYAVKDSDGEILESCGGFLVAGEEDEKELKAEAEAEAKSIADARVCEAQRNASGLGAWAPSPV